MTQLVLGLCIPPLLANHLANTRVAFAKFGLNKGYAQLLYSFWIASPFFGRAQLMLLVVARIGCQVRALRPDAGFDEHVPDV